MYVIQNTEFCFYKDRVNDGRDRERHNFVGTLFSNQRSSEPSCRLDSLGGKTQINIDLFSIYIYIG